MQKRFLSIWFPHLATDWHTAKSPHLQNVPFVLKAPSRNREVVTAANPLAQAQGICSGMAVADAKALCSSLQVLEDKADLTTQLLNRMAEWCIRFTPVAAPQSPNGIVLDASGCTHLWGGEEPYRRDIGRRLAARGYMLRIAVADTVGCAWAVARYAKDKRVIESGGQRQALLSLPVAALRLDNETVMRLQKLGLQRIQDIVELPSSSLRRRFGPGLLQRLRQALGEEKEFITPVYPVEPYQERLPCVDPIVSLTGIEIALHRLIQTLCHRLRTEGKGLRAAVFRCYRTDGGAQGIEIGTARPSHNEEHLFRLFSLKLSVIEPKEGFELFLLHATKVEDHEPQQESLWQAAAGLNDAALAELIDRLTGKVGADAVSRYLPAEHYWPERSFKKATSLTEQPTTEWKGDRPRPVQLLATPQQIEVTAPFPDYPPMNFRYNGALHKIVKADGPERIEREWWIDEGEHRDYYCVEDEKGQRYWVFRSGHYTTGTQHQWYLHGFFA